MEKRGTILEVLKRSPNTPFTPNEITVILRNKSRFIKVHHSEVLKILLEEYANDSQNIGYKKVARIHLFWFKSSKNKKVKLWKK